MRQQAAYADRRVEQIPRAAELPYMVVEARGELGEGLLQDGGPRAAVLFIAGFPG